MTSGILDELDRSISACSSELGAALLRAEKALHMARRGGEYERCAAGEIEALRRVNLSWGHPSLSAWCNVAEGMLSLTIGEYARADDRLERARVVSDSVGDRRVQSWAVALQAFISYVRDQFRDAVRRVRQVIDWAGDADPLALARAKMLVGELLHYAGEFELARPWYDESRSHAISRRDDGFLSALLFNIASHQFSLLRQEYVRGRSSTTFARMVVLAVESVENYDELVDITSQESMLSALRASIDAFCGKFAEADARLQTLQMITKDAGVTNFNSICLADRAFCLLRIGERNRVIPAAIEAEEAIPRSEHPENAAYTRDRLAQVYLEIGLEDRAAVLREAAEKDWRRFEARQAFALDCLREFNFL